MLLDENLDHALRKLLGHHEVVTVNYMGWAGLKNGGPLRMAEKSDIDVLFPETNPSVMSKTWPVGGWQLWHFRRFASIIRQSLPKIIGAIDAAAPGSFQAVECRTFSRKKPWE